MWCDSTCTESLTILDVRSISRGTDFLEQSKNTSSMRSKMSLGGFCRANFLVKMIFISMIYDAVDKKREHENSCLKNVKEFALFVKRLELCHWCFCGSQPQSKCVESEQTEWCLGFSCDRDEANVERRTPSSSLCMRTPSVTRKTFDKELQATESSPVNSTKQNTVEKYCSFVDIALCAGGI